VLVSLIDSERGGGGGITVGGRRAGRPAAGLRSPRRPGMKDSTSGSDSTDDDEVVGAGRESVDEAHGALKAGREDGQGVSVAGRESVDEEFGP
jgi:hypothetical protein